MKTTKGGKVMNPTDAFRKEIRKKELKRNKKERKKVREVGILKKDPAAIKEQIDKLNMMKADGALDKARKHKKRHLEDTLNLVIKKRKEYEEKVQEGEAPVMFSHLGPPRRRANAEEEERGRNPQPEDSVYYHPTLNPTGAPPPGKPPMFKSSIGPRIPLTAASSSGASSSKTDSDVADLDVPPPPPPPPLPSDGDAGDDPINPASLPLPPPPPMPPKPPVPDFGTLLPPPSFHPPPPGPPPKEQGSSRPPLPPPPPPPGTQRPERENNQTADQSSKQPFHGHAILPPPPKLGSFQHEGASSDSDVNKVSGSNEFQKMIPPPPPPRQQLPVPRLGPVSNLHPDVLPPGISLFAPPPPPPEMRPPLSAPGQSVPPGVMVPLIPRPPVGPPPGPPPMMRPPLPPGPPPVPVDDYLARPFVAQKPSYVKSAASTVVKRPLAQHTPELTKMVPASVRVRRETAASKSKPKPPLSAASVASKPPSAPTIVKAQAVTSSSSRAAPKAPSIDDSYMAFLEDMKVLGALDS